MTVRDLRRQPRWRAAWVCVLLSAPAVAFAASDVAEALSQAEAAYQSFEFERCVEILEPWSLATQGATPQALAQVQLNLGVCQFFLQRQGEAEKRFEAALLRDPEARLPPMTSPKIQAVFSEVLARLKPTLSEPSPVIAPLTPETPEVKSASVDSPSTQLWIRWSADALSGAQQAGANRFLRSGWTANDFALGVEQKLWKSGGGLVELGRTGQSALTELSPSAVSTGLYRVSLAPWMAWVWAQWRLRLTGGYRLGQLALLSGSATALSLSPATWHGLFGRANFTARLSQRLSADIQAELAHALGPRPPASAGLGATLWFSVLDGPKTSWRMGPGYLWESTWMNREGQTSFTQRAHQLQLNLKMWIH